MESLDITELDIRSHEIKNSSLVFRAVNHKLRQQLLMLLHKQGRMKVTDIYTKMELDQSLVSQHLAILRNAGFVKTQRERKCIFYSVNYERLKGVEEIAVKMIAG